MDTVATLLRQCEFRFYEELGDFLAPEHRKRSFVHAFDGTPAVKDRIESLGVPHTEVDLILVDDEPVPFSHRLSGGERVAVYPVFERFELGEGNRLRPRPLREPKFVLDVHLGRLASYLRLLGFDTLYRNDYGDDELLSVSCAQHRTLLTRDTGLLKRAALTHGAFLHATDPRRQLREVLDRFQLDARVAPFTRCARCNGIVDIVVAAPDEPDPDHEPAPGHDPARPAPHQRDPDEGDPVERDPGQGDPARRDPRQPPAVRDPQVPGRTDPGKLGRRATARPGPPPSMPLSQCRDCRQFYWPGSHLARLRQRLAEVGVPI